MSDQRDAGKCSAVELVTMTKVRLNFGKIFALALQ